MTVKSQDDCPKCREHRSVDVLTSAIDMLRKMKAENTRLKRENLMFGIANRELNDKMTIIRKKIDNALNNDAVSFWDALTSIKKDLPNDQ